MNDLAPLELIAASRWRRTVFTTYALSLSFFEAVVLDRLTRAAAENATILSDVEGVRAALGEQGARGVGRDYRVEPVSVDGGVFHPKITVLSSDDDHHILVGSGNLTFGGWGGNFEVIEHLHPSFAADAFEDTAQLFEQLGSPGRVRHQAQDLCHSLTGDLRKAAARGTPNNQIRVLHSIDRSIQAKIVELADDLGGATRLVIASPFWSSSALDNLCEALRLDEAFVHSHQGGAVRGRLGTNWPTETKLRVHAIRLELLDRDEKPRPLHAKAYEIICKRGRIVLSGSANATTAALGSTHNVEAVVARLQRQPVSTWAFEKAKPLTPQPSPDDEITEFCRVLRAELVGDKIEGTVLEPRMTGSALLYRLSSEGRDFLGNVVLSADAYFSILAPSLELLAWRGDRLIIRVEQVSGTSAEGFVTVGSYTEIRRRIGPVAPRLFAILAGTETPADVAAVMSWLQENPSLLRSAPGAFHGHGNSDEHQNSDVKVAVADLIGPASVVRRTVDGEHGAYVPAWKRFLDGVFAALRKPRGPFIKPSGSVEVSDDDEEGDSGEDKSIDPAIEQSIDYFDRLLELFLSPDNALQLGMHAFDLAQYVADRLQPDFATVKSWLARILRALCQYGFPPERLNDVIGAALLLDEVTPAAQRDAHHLRLRLLRVGAALTDSMPDFSGIEKFREILAPAADFGPRWNELKAIRSMPEQARAYLDAMTVGVPSDGYPDLPRLVPEIWPTLAEAITDPDMRSEIVELPNPLGYCPRCNIALPVRDAIDLEDRRFARSRNCCDRILVCREL